MIAFLAAIPLRAWIIVPLLGAVLVACWRQASESDRKDRSP